MFLITDGDPHVATKCGEGHTIESYDVNSLTPRAC